jgi:hypothetical protein
MSKQVNTLKGFTFSMGSAQIGMKLANATKTASDFTKEELHKYMKEKFNGTSSAFDALVGEYDSDRIDITGLSITKSQALVAMQAFLKQAKTIDMPFSNLVAKNAEVGVNPINYILTDSAGQVTKVPMIRGLPSTEPAPVIMAHSHLTFAMSTSTPEVDKVTIGGVSRKTMMRSVPTDPSGRYYIPVDIINLLDPLEENYKDGNNILAVRAKILTQAKDAGNLMDVGAVVLSAMQEAINHLKRAKRWQPKWDIFDCVRPIEDPQQIAIYRKAEVEPLRMVPPRTLPTFKVKDMDQLWTLLESHRDIRGSDSGKISPLTHAVYYGETDNYYRHIVGTADIMHVLKAMKCNAVQFTPNPYFNRVWNTVQLNCPLITYNMNDKEWAGEEYGSYLLPKDTKVLTGLTVLALECINQIQPTRNSKTKLWEYTPTRDVCISRIKQFFTMHMNCAVKIYPYPELWQDFPNQIYPSLHAHSGTVWVVNRECSPYTIDDHIKRVVRANVLKTYYPCLMQRFATKDIVEWPTVYVKRTAKRAVHLGFEIMYTEEDSVYEGVDIALTDVQQKKLAETDSKVMTSAPAVQKFSSMKADMEKKLAQAPMENKKQTKDDYFAGLSVDDDNAFGQPDGYNDDDQEHEDGDENADEEEEEGDDNGDGDEEQDEQAASQDEPQEEVTEADQNDHETADNGGDSDG